MRFLTIEQKGIETAAVLDGSRNVVTIQAINEKMDKAWPTDLFELLQSESFERFKNWWDKLPKQEKESLDIAEKYNVGPLYRRPRKIWGIGLNYVDHASDLEEQAPQKEPASFMKPDTTIIGHEGNYLYSHPIGANDRRSGIRYHNWTNLQRCSRGRSISGGRRIYHHN